jgi:hypothetical protein
MERCGVRPIVGNVRSRRTSLCGQVRSVTLRNIEVTESIYSISQIH